MICLFILLGFNLLMVKIFGELEFWFVLIKVIMIFVLIVIGVILLVIGFKMYIGMVLAVNLWVYGGLFLNGFLGFLFLF